MSKTEETVTKLGISAAAMVTSAYVGSLIGNSGTLIGTGIGAVLGGGATELYQHLLDRGKYHFKSIKRTQKRYIAGGAMALAAAVAGYGGISVVEASTGHTLHSITTGKKDYGTSIGGSSSTPPTPSASTPTPNSSGTSSVATSLVPVPSSSSSAPSAPAAPPSVPATVATPSATIITPTTTSVPTIQSTQQATPAAGG